MRGHPPERWQSFADGALLAVEMTRAAIPEPGRWKLPLVRPAPAIAPQAEPGWHFSDEPWVLFLRRLAPALGEIVCPIAAVANEVRSDLGEATPVLRIDPEAIADADFAGLIEAAVTRRISRSPAARFDRTHPGDDHDRHRRQRRSAGTQSCGGARNSAPATAARYRRASRHRFPHSGRPPGARRSRCRPGRGLRSTWPAQVHGDERLRLCPDRPPAPGPVDPRAALRHHAWPPLAGKPRHCPAARGGALARAWQARNWSRHPRSSS